MWRALLDLLSNSPTWLHRSWTGMMRFLPDLEVGTFEIRDLVNVVVGGLGAYLAYLAIRMGQSQGRIALRQADIAEVQHRIMQEQLAKAAKLRVRGDTAQSHQAPETIIPIEVFNDGNKTARGFFWELLCADTVAQHVRMVDGNGTPIPSIAGIVGADNTFYDQYDGHRDEALFSRQHGSGWQHPRKYKRGPGIHYVVAHSI